MYKVLKKIPKSSEDTLSSKMLQISVFHQKWNLFFLFFFGVEEGGLEIFLTFHKWRINFEKNWSKIEIFEDLSIFIFLKEGSGEDLKFFHKF